MNEWDKAFEDHEVHDALDTLSKKLDTFHGPNAASLESVERFHAALAFVKRRLNAVDPLLLPSDQVDALTAVLRAMYSDLNAHLAEPKGGHWGSATSRIDPVIKAADALITMTDAADVDGLRDSAKRYRRSASQLVERLERNVKEVEKKVAALSETAAEKAATIAAQLEDAEKIGRQIRETFTENESDRAVLFKRQIATAEADVAAFVSGAGEQLEAVTAQHAAAHKELLSENETSAGELITTMEQALARALAGAKDSTMAMLGELDTLKEQARESVGIIASTGMAGGYEKTAIDEQKAADRWRIIATGAFVGMVTIALLLAFWPYISKTPLSWESFAAKAYASLAFALLAGYAGREAEKHRVAERHHRQRSLELRSLNPYLEPLSSDKQSEIRALVAERIFGRETSTPSDADQGIPSSTMAELIKLLLAEKK